MPASSPNGRRPVSGHMLRGNAREWSPPAVLFFDTESRWSEGPTGELHTLRLWSAYSIVRRDADGHAGRELRGSGTTVGELADFLVKAVRGIDTLWCFAHNLSFDLGLTRLPDELARRGWTPQAQSVNPTSPWLRLGLRSKRLTFCDSTTYLPRPLAVIGDEIGIPKLTLPDNSDSQADWQARCDRDVEILSAAVLALMDWWDRGRYGNWSITGPATGFNALRHRPDCPRVLVEHDPAQLAFEREAIYGGRRETFRVGDLGPGVYTDRDIHGAYPTVAASKALPRARAGTFSALTLDRYQHLPDNVGIIARCAVHNAGGHVPVRIEGEVWYPRGDAVTVLASPEIDHLIASGAKVKIGPGILYYLTTGYAGWANWCMAVADGNLPDTPAVARIAAKHWSRAVIGKFAAHTSVVEKLGQSWRPGWAAEEGIDLATGKSFCDVHLAGQRYRVSEGDFADNAFPAVFAFVESHTRVWLDQMIRELPGGEVVQCDTDGVLTAQWPDQSWQSIGAVIATRRWEDRKGVPEPAAVWADVRLGIDLRTKGRYESCELIGPQHLMLGETRRLAGVPRDAQTTDGVTFSGRSWPGVRWQLMQGLRSGYVRPRLSSTLRGPYCHRWVLADGSTMAVTTRVVDRRTVIAPWHESAPPGHTAALATAQHEQLEPYAPPARDRLPLGSAPAPRQSAHAPRRRPAAGDACGGGAV